MFPPTPATDVCSPCFSDFIDGQPGSFPCALAQITSCRAGRPQRKKLREHIVAQFNCLGARMTFHIAASNNAGRVKLERRTAKEAFALAKSYRSTGFEAISVTNILTGETFAEHDILADRLPAEPVAEPGALRSTAD